MKAKKYIFLIASSLFIFSSCSKSPNVAGAQGPQGAQGASSSYYVTIDSIPVNGWAGSNGVYTFAPILVGNLSDITNSIVEVYYEYGVHYNSPQANYFELPTQDATDDGLFQFSYTTNYVTIQFISANLGSPAPPLQQIYVKIVVITKP